MQVAELIIFAVLAGVVLYQLYAVLGRRVGRQPEEVGQATQAPTVRKPIGTVSDASPVSTGLDVPGLADLMAADPSFNPEVFLVGARQAHKQILEAFVAGERETLKTLISEEMMGVFDPAIDARTANGSTERVEFISPTRADLEAVTLLDGKAQVMVRLLAELRSTVQTNGSETHDERRTAEVWTFERAMKAKDPNWLLIHVAAVAD